MDSSFNICFYFYTAPVIIIVSGMLPRRPDIGIDVKAMNGNIARKSGRKKKKKSYLYRYLFCPLSSAHL